MSYISPYELSHEALLKTHHEAIAELEKARALGATDAELDRLQIVVSRYYWANLARCLQAVCPFRRGDKVLIRTAAGKRRMQIHTVKDVYYLGDHWRISRESDGWWFLDSRLELAERAGQDEQLAA
ncbi:MAG: hypothetical protein JWN18_556 [Parcubacteria group bacterium]|nr:hypothetical protein [Parcubacteria group bacterium]